MDPNQTLARIRELTTIVLDDNPAYAAEELAELVQGLDAWLSRGGFMPEVWARANTELSQMTLERNAALAERQRWQEHCKAVDLKLQKNLATIRGAYSATTTPSYGGKIK